jgi:hypothetical protein
MRIRCYCNKTVANNDNEDLVQCDLCRLYYHPYCLLERFEEQDGLLGESIDIEANKCHVCYQIENSDVYTLSQKAEKEKRKYKKRKPIKDTLKDSPSNGKKLESPTIVADGRKQKNYDVICDTIDLTQDDDTSNKAGCPLKSRFPDSYPLILPKVKKLKIKEESSSSSSILSFSSPTSSSVTSNLSPPQGSHSPPASSELSRQVFPLSSSSSGPSSISALSLNKNQFIRRGDYVRVILPGNKIPSEGYIMDFEGKKKARFHIKGNNRDSDTWVLLSTCEKIIENSESSEKDGIGMTEVKQPTLA